jgi:hypothetical protein
MLRAGAAAGTAAALGAAGIFAAGTASAATTAGRRAGGLPYPPHVTDTSHRTRQVAAILRGFFTAKSEHDTAALMSYFSTANACYIDACLGVALTGWQAINNEFSTFATLPADAISYPLRIVGEHAKRGNRVRGHPRVLLRPGAALPVLGQLRQRLQDHPLG